MLCNRRHIRSEDHTVLVAQRLDNPWVSSTCLPLSLSLSRSLSDENGGMCEGVCVHSARVLLYVGYVVSIARGSNIHLDVMEYFCNHVMDIIHRLSEANTAEDKTS